MKIIVSSGYVFRPSTSPATIDFSGAPAVTPASLLAIVNATNAGPVYAAGKPGLGGQWTGTVLALNAPVLGMLSTDHLVVVVDDGAPGARDATLAAASALAHADAGAIEAILATLAADHTVQGVTDKLEAVRAILAAPLTVGLPAGAATDATLQSILLKNEAIRALLAGAATAAAQATANVALAALVTAAAAATPAGTNLIGKVVPQINSADVSLGNRMPVLDEPFRPVIGATVSLSVGPSVTVAPVALPACIASSYRVRNAGTSSAPVTWILAPNNAGGATVPKIPAPYSVAGTAGTPGDKTIDPGGVEIIGLSPAQQTALAAGTLFLSAICPPGGSGVLSITPGEGV